MVNALMATSRERRAASSVLERRPSIGRQPGTQIRMRRPYASAAFEHDENSANVARGASL